MSVIADSNCLFGKYLCDNIWRLETCVLATVEPETKVAGLSACIFPMKPKTFAELPAEALHAVANFVREHSEKHTYS